MDERRIKAALNRDKAVRLKGAWGVRAEQVRYSDDGHWYAMVNRFPAALFDAHGYVLFATEAEFLASKYIRAGKLISVPKPGISAIPGYVRVAGESSAPGQDVDIHDDAAAEGRRRLVLHLQRERNQTVVRKRGSRPNRSTASFAGSPSVKNTVKPPTATARYTT